MRYFAIRRLTFFSRINSPGVCKVFVTGRRGGVSPPDSEALFGRGDLAPTMSGVVFSHSAVNFDKIFTHP